MASSLAIAVLLGAPVLATNARTPTPQMGWNTYNTYSCTPNEDIVKENAQALVDTGLADLGYLYVTPDCGWNMPGRDSDGRQQWNNETFPSGGKALGEYIHSLGLKFGMYSGGGYYQCGSSDQPASLGYEEIDAAAYDEWGADSLKYDNCYCTSPYVMAEYDDPISGSPERFRTMAAALDTVDRDILYQICQWGVGTDIGEWAPELGTSWRISNDIYDAWRSIWRIANQAAPYAALDQTGIGRHADMDMLVVGLGALSHEEEKFHFGMWSILKSPLIIGCAIVELPDTSFDILSNEDVIALNQDSLGDSAKLIRRDTENEWDVWAGDLSGRRKVVGVANWRDGSQTISLDLSDIGVSSAMARDVWAAEDIGRLSGTTDVELAGHELKLYVLSNIMTAGDYLDSTGYYAAANASLAGGAVVTSCGSGECLPVGSKLSYLGGSDDGTATFSSLKFTSSGTKTIGFDFINYDVALATAWDWGSNSRNVTLAVNGGTATRWALPLSGGDWYQTGRMELVVEGFVAGDNNTVVVAGHGDYYAVDLVGIETFE
ncbi:putative alpha-galactosidase D [Zalerion maritima]|uniref:Alpha-galactosidase n=1 Tax=Zalerion maritima TaxID=339359 RepID=A0AAD5RMT7_9PEZI|nr:putative alpha-galactosidase D [Zalerion maritima]